MKKIITVICLGLLVSFSAFSNNFFSKRFFEVQTNIPAGISNNVFTLDEILTKNLVIDLRKIAKSVPQEGVIFTTTANPSISYNLNLDSFNAGVSFGIDVSERFIISKDLFDFFGYGNEIGEELEIAFKNYTDVYFYINAKAKMYMKDFDLMIMPTLFVPLFSSSGTAGSFSALNDEDGNLLIKLKSDLSYYSNIQLEGPMSGLNELFRTSGVDLSGEVGFPLNDMADLRIAGRVPVVPGKLNNQSFVYMETTIDTKVTGLADADVQTSNMAVVTTESTYYVNRPLKADAYIDISPMGSFIDFTVGLGAGIYHPFSADISVYPEYYLGVELSLADILKAYASTEYTDQVYKHQFGAGFNLRLLELDAGVSFQSASFTKSFAGSGMGGFVTISAGF